LCCVESVDSVGASPKLRPPSPRLAGSSVTLVAVTRERLKQGIWHFFAAVCSPTCPVVFFLDDLQWADPASLDLLSSLIVDRIPGLLIVGACRDDELDPTTSHLSVLLREVESMKATIVQVVVSNVGHTGLSSMLLDSPFHMIGSKAQALSHLLLEKTNGNMLFVLFLLNFLRHQGLVYPSDRSWTFDCEENIQNILGKVIHARSLVDFGIRVQSKLTREVLAVASCLGAEFTERLLTSAIEVPVEASLRILEHSGLLKKPKTQSGTWRFVHNQIHQSAYALIPRVKREKVHLRIGRNLWRALSEVELDLHANVVVTQLLLGADLVNDRKEREQLAILLLRAGESAAKSSSHVTAEEYICHGMRLLEARHWRDQYTLSLRLFNAAAEVEYCIGNFSRMDGLLEAILTNARTKNDMVRAFTTQIYALGSRNEPTRAIEVGIKTLKECFGESLPSKPSPVVVFVELMKTKRMLRRLSDDDILSLHSMVDSKKLDSMRIMCLLWVYAMISNPSTAPVLTLRMVQHSLQFGMSGMSGTAFAYYGMLLSAFLDDVDAGIRYGKVGLRIIERFGAIEHLARVSNVVHGYSLPYREPLRDQLRPMLLAHRIGLGAGDIQVSIMATAFYGAVALHSSAPLSELSQELTSFIRLSEAYQQTTTTPPLRQAAQFVECMIGGCSNASILNGSFMSWGSALMEAKHSGITAWTQNMWLLRLMLASYFGNVEEAEIAYKTLARFGMTSFTCFMKAAAWLHGGIAAIEMSYRQNRRRRINQARRNLRQLTKLSGYSKHNYGSKASLLAAELAVAQGDFHQGKLLYEESISLAKVARLWCDAALGCERLSRALKNRSRSDQSIAYDEAIYFYDAWGATAKAAELRKNRERS
jgi:predicted ATPase